MVNFSEMDITTRREKSIIFFINTALNNDEIKINKSLDKSLSRIHTYMYRRELDIFHAVYTAPTLFAIITILPSLSSAVIPFGIKKMANFVLLEGGFLFSFSYERVGH